MPDWTLVRIKIKIAKLPWNIVQMNMRGQGRNSNKTATLVVCSLDSQCWKSDQPIHGWGKSGGRYVFESFPSKVSFMFGSWSTESWDSDPIYQLTGCIQARPHWYANRQSQHGVCRAGFCPEGLAPLMIHFWAKQTMSALSMVQLKAWHRCSVLVGG